jgi:chromosome segregation ATPase
MELRRLAFTILFLFITCALGCQGGAKQTSQDSAKREHDRAVMKLADVERERDQMRDQVTQMQSRVQAAEKQAHEAQAEVDAARQRVKQLETDVADARRAQEAMRLEAQKQLDELRAAQQKPKAAPPTTAPTTTAPAMNK